METQSSMISIETTPNEIVAEFPHMLSYFEALDIDDCCMELDLGTLASHLGRDEAGLIQDVRHATQRP